MRSNTNQIRSTAMYQGMRGGETKRNHNKITPKQRQVTGKNSVWAARHVDIDTMAWATYVPVAIIPPRG